MVKKNKPFNRGRKGVDRAFRAEEDVCRGWGLEKALTWRARRGEERGTERSSAHLINYYVIFFLTASDIVNSRKKGRTRCRMPLLLLLFESVLLLFG
jgi:hypothetical protein